MIIATTAVLRIHGAAGRHTKRDGVHASLMKTLKTGSMITKKKSGTFMKTVMSISMMMNRIFCSSMMTMKMNYTIMMKKMTIGMWLKKNR